MGIKHKITINVSDPKGKSKTILKGANMKLPARIVRLLFGDYQQIYLLSPGQTVESVDIREIPKKGEDADLLFPQFMNDTNPEERNAAEHFDYVLLGKCKEIWVFGGIITKGMEHEIHVAKKRRQKIRWFNANLEEVEEYGV